MEPKGNCGAWLLNNSSKRSWTLIPVDGCVVDYSEIEAPPEALRTDPRLQKYVKFALKNKLRLEHCLVETLFEDFKPVDVYEEPFLKPDDPPSRFIVPPPPPPPAPILRYLMSP